MRCLGSAFQTSNLSRQDAIHFSLLGVFVDTGERICVFVDIAITPVYYLFRRRDPAARRTVRVNLSVSRECSNVLTSLCSCRLSIARKPSALSLGPKDVLKVTFQVVDEEGKGVQPHQTFLRFYDEVSGEEGVQPVKVTAGGKAKFELVSTVLRLMRVRSDMPVGPQRTWPNHQHPSHPQPRLTRYKSPSLSGPSHTLL